MEETWIDSSFKNLMGKNQNIWEGRNLEGRFLLLKKKKKSSGEIWTEIEKG